MSDPEMVHHNIAMRSIDKNAANQVFVAVHPHCRLEQPFSYLPHSPFLPDAFAAMPSKRGMQQKEPVDPWMTLRR